MATAAPSALRQATQRRLMPGTPQAWQMVVLAAKTLPVCAKGLQASFTWLIYVTPPATKSARCTA